MKRWARISIPLVVIAVVAVLVAIAPWKETSPVSGERILFNDTYFLREGGYVDLSVDLSLHADDVIYGGINTGEGGRAIDFLVLDQEGYEAFLDWY